MKLKHRKKDTRKISLTKRRSRGAVGAGTMYVLAILLLISAGSFLFMGGKLPNENAPQDGQVVMPVTNTPEPDKKNLQLYTFGFITQEPVQGNACEANKFNEEPDIFLASDPPAGGVAKSGGQIRVWVDDGNGGSVAPGTKIDPNTGQITTPGDRNASDGLGRKESSPYNYYLWEPALYLTPLTSPGQPGPYAGDAENGGIPRFPQFVKGEVSQGDDGNNSGFIQPMPKHDPPANAVAKKGHGGHIAEYIWDVNTLGLQPGYYRVQIVVHDGDGDLAINCTTIQI